MVQITQCEGAILTKKIISMGNGWLKEQDQQFFNNSILALEKRWTKCISVTGDHVEKCQNIVYTSCD